MKIKESILATLTYSDIFQYPLTLPEIYRNFHGTRPTSQDEIKKTLFSVEGIESHEEFFFLKGRKKLAFRRKMREEESKKKLKKAKKMAKILSIIPTIRYIAISGSLSQGNAGKEDDIDLFFVTQQNTVWLTRFLLNLLLIFTMQKRKKNVRQAPDKICPNMIVSEATLTIPPQSRTFYTARELTQLVPLIDRHSTHTRLLQANTWVKKILPNTAIPNKKISHSQKKHLLIAKCDELLYRLQKSRMHITNETVTQNIAKFHPRDTGKMVMFLYIKRLVRVLGEDSAKRIISRQIPSSIQKP